MAEAQLDGAAIKDWDSFHAQCAERFGFPAFYGRGRWRDPGIASAISLEAAVAGV